jgi:putative endonuclease
VAELVDLPAGRQARWKSNVEIMVWVYALASLVKNYIYVGTTVDLENRISRHNGGREKTTKPYIPFVLIYSEKRKDRSEARKREKYWKSGSGKERLKMLREKMLNDPDGRNCNEV